MGIGWMRGAASAAQERRQPIFAVITAAAANPSAQPACVDVESAVSYEAVIKN